mgnify:CR=1 FL=1
MTYFRRQSGTKYKRGAFKWIALTVASFLFIGTIGSFGAQATDESGEPDSSPSADLTITGPGTVSVTEDVNGKTSGEGIYQFETAAEVTLTPVPDEGAEFSHWEGITNGKETDNPLMLVIQDDLFLTAHFIAPGTDKEKTTPTDDVTTDVTHDDTGELTAGEGTYEEETELSLEAAGEDYEFVEKTSDFGNTLTLPSTSVDNSGSDFVPGFYVGNNDTLIYNGTGTLTFKGGLQAAGIGGKGVNTGSNTVAADSLIGNVTFGEVGQVGNFKITAYGGDWGAGIGDGDTNKSNPVTDEPRTITMNSGIIIGYADKAAGIGTQDELSTTQMILDFKNAREGSFAVGASSGACGIGA